MNSLKLTRMCTTDPCFLGGGFGLSPSTVPNPNQGGERFLQVKLGRRVETTPSRRPDVVTLVGLHAEMSLTLSADSSFLLPCVQNESATPGIERLSSWRLPSLRRAAFSRASPPWLRACRGHLGWPRCENPTAAAAPRRGRCVYLAYGASTDTYLRHVERDWPTAVFACL